MKKTFYITLIMLILLAFLVSAKMPEDHIRDVQIVAAQYSDTPVAKIANQYPEDFWACNIQTDFSLLYYFSNGFASVGKEYKDTHSKEFCKKMVSISKSDSDLACAYGVCAHHVDDSYLHNEVVPPLIKKTGLSNGLIHPLIEEKLNDLIVTAKLRSQTRNALVNKAKEHKEQFRNALMCSSCIGSKDFPFDKMYDAFITTVVGSSKYSIGFAAFFAIPFGIHAMLVLTAILFLIISILLVRKGLKSKFGIAILILCILMVLFIVGLYVLFYTNTLWKAFETLSTPLSSIIPINNVATIQQVSVQREADFFRNGVSYINTIKDPSGAAELEAANMDVAWIQILISITLIIVIVVLGYLTIKSEFKKK